MHPRPRLVTGDEGRTRWTLRHVDGVSDGVSDAVSLPAEEQHAGQVGVEDADVAVSLSGETGGAGAR